MRTDNVIPLLGDDYHVPVLAEQILDIIKPSERGIIVDCTLGGGGHSSLMVKQMSSGSILYGIDRDDEAIKRAGARIDGIEKTAQFKAIHGNFHDIKTLMRGEGVEKIDAAVIDLGVSSHQLDEPERGFSYMHPEAKLDMRMDKSSGLSAYDVVNGYDKARLTKILYDYGEEKFSPRIANEIIKARQNKPIETTGELVEIIKKSMPPSALREKQHPAKRTFQAIRIEVNGELTGLDEALNDALDMLNPGGVLAVITFHSLEDRIVKNAMRTMANPCTCPPKSPVCICGKLPKAELLTRKPITANENELTANPRARSAKLRAVIRI